MPRTIFLYPEPYYPRYCQGAGFALSWKFVHCAASTNEHIAKARFMPFEDVAVGILAERCGYHPHLTQTGEIKLTRYDSMEAKKRTKANDKRVDN